MSALELRHKSADHAATSHTEGMSEGDSATLRVELLLRNSESLDTVRGLRGEGLVDLENVDVVDAETAILKGSRDSVSGANTHNLGRHTSGSEAHNATNNLGTDAVCNISACKQNAGSTISDLR